MSNASQSLEDRLDQRTVVEGTKENAKAGAVVLTANGVPVYVRGRREWSDEELGQPVRLSGTLRRGRIYPDVREDAGGISQGIADEQWFLERDGEA